VARSVWREGKAVRPYLSLLLVKIALTGRTSLLIVDAQKQRRGRLSLAELLRQPTTVVKRPTAQKLLFCNPVIRLYRTLERIIPCLLSLAAR
jgi:hypothetical protein